MYFLPLLDPLNIILILFLRHEQYYYEYLNFKLSNTLFNIIKSKLYDLICITSFPLIEHAILFPESKKTSRNTFVPRCFYQIKLQLIIIQCRFHLQFISCCTRNIILCIDFKHFRFSCAHVHNNTVSCSF